MIEIVGVLTNCLPVSTTLRDDSSTGIAILSGRGGTETTGAINV